MQQLSSRWSAAWRDPQHKAGFDLTSRYSDKRIRQHVFIQFVGNQDTPRRVTIEARPDGAPLATPLDRSLRLLKRVLPI